MPSLIEIYLVGAEDEGNKSLGESLSVRVARYAEVKRRGKDGRRRKSSMTRGRGSRQQRGKGKGKGLNKKTKKAIKRTNRQKNNVQKTKKTKSGHETDDCFKPAMKYMEQMANVVSNFERQLKRAEKHELLMEKKNMKSYIFTDVARTLLIAGGGNLENMTCGGEMGNAGADALLVLTVGLGLCPEAINASCGNQTYTPLNATLVAECSTLIADFKAKVQVCKDASKAAPDCDCWNAPELAAMSKKLKMCSIKEAQVAITAQKTLCVNEFQKCRGLEDDSVFALAACQSPSELKATVRYLSVMSYKSN